jgi:hypothetical protein
MLLAFLSRFTSFHFCGTSAAPLFWLLTSRHHCTYTLNEQVCASLLLLSWFSMPLHRLLLLLRQLFLPPFASLVLQSLPEHICSSSVQALGILIRLPLFLTLQHNSLHGVPINGDNHPVVKSTPTCTVPKLILVLLSLKSS